MSHTHSHTHIDTYRKWFCLVGFCCLNTKSLWWCPPLHSLTPPAVSQGGETQTRAQRALSTPQPLNTSSALPFENKPSPRLKLVVSYVSTHATHSAGSSLETSMPSFQEADVRMAAITHDASLGNVWTISLVAKLWRRGERCRISWSRPKLAVRTQW